MLLLKIKLELVLLVSSYHYVKLNYLIKNEILIKHDALMDGYYKMKDETNKTIIDGWLHTGDEGLYR